MHLRWVYIAPFSVLHFWGETCLNILYTIIYSFLHCWNLWFNYTIIYSFYHLTVTKRHSTIINIDQAACLDYSAIGLTNPSPRINSGMIDNSYTFTNLRVRSQSTQGLIVQKTHCYMSDSYSIITQYYTSTMIAVQHIVFNYMQNLCILTNYL